ncbi:DCL family protein [Pseudonocardia zijingensis]|uniref:DUF3223 domain-containing protein n=1 Tax=Pseudonocardia zijingensis TaxID=153376 RepID=A0ABN1N8R6_9PSEU
MAPYLLGARRYPSKKAARDEFRRILNSNPDNVPLRGEDAELVSLLVHAGRHPEAAEKVGPGVVDVVIRRSEFGTRGFWLVRRDGSIVDFSYLTALDGQSSVEAEARAALRWEVNDQILAFRDVHAADLAGGTVTCGLCQQLMTPDNVHVDHHEPTFDELASRFAEVLGGWDRLVIEWVGATGRRLQNRDHGDVWQTYHRQTAQLRLTHRRCNLSRART